MRRSTFTCSSRSDLKQIDHPQQIADAHATSERGATRQRTRVPGQRRSAGRSAARLEGQRRSECVLRATENAPLRSRRTGSRIGETTAGRITAASTRSPRPTSSRLAPRWSFQFGTGAVESSPLVVDGLMFVTGPLNNAAALDARTGRPIWRYTRTLPNVAAHCTVMANRGFAILGDRLFMATLDSHLVALDAKTGAVASGTSRSTITRKASRSPTLLSRSTGRSSSGSPPANAL